MEDDFVAAAVALQREWKQAFEAGDIAHLSELYTNPTAFYGSTPGFYTTPSEVRTYFATLPLRYTRVDFPVPHIVRLGSDAMVATAEVTFHSESGGVVTPHPFRLMQVLVRSSQHWKIAAHHASPRPA